MDAPNYYYLHGRLRRTATSDEIAAYKAQDETRPLGRYERTRRAHKSEKTHVWLAFVEPARRYSFTEFESLVTQTLANGVVYLEQVPAKKLGDRILDPLRFINAVKVAS